MPRYLPFALLALTTASLAAAPAVRIILPERFRLLTRQYFDLRIEAYGLTNASATLVLRDANGKDLSSQFGTADEVTTDNDQDAGNLDKAWVYRAKSFSDEGIKTLVAEVSDPGGKASATQKIGVQRFRVKTGPKKNIILFIGDAMGEAYRDAGRDVLGSAGNRLRGGFFDQLLEMDRMPSSGMVLTHAATGLVPDSANTASAWCMGNKTTIGMLNVFPDNNDWRQSSAALLDNPRVETLWSYLKRLHGYKTGIISTAHITDATPAAEGGYTASRELTFDIARQFVDGVFSPGPEFDVILGGGRYEFEQRTLNQAGDTRNLIQELVAKGYHFAGNRTELNAPVTAPDKLLGLFADSTMTVTYDKLGYSRPQDEGSTFDPNFPNQPFLDEMTSRAIATLSKDNAPFILMVEGASIDKQSHQNQAAGTIWEVIELDRAVGVGRAFAKANTQRKTLVLATADHNQSMQVLGVVQATLAGATENFRAEDGFFGIIGSTGGFPNYEFDPQTGYPRNDNLYRLAVGFRTHEHTASPVPVTAEGPGASLFTGVFDQTDLFFKMARILDSNTAKLDRLEQERAKLKIVDQNYATGD